MANFHNFHWITDFEKACKENVTLNLWDKLLGHPERGITFRRNEEAFTRCFHNAYLQNVS